MTFALLVDTSRRVAETRAAAPRSRCSPTCSGPSPPEELEIGVAYLSGMVLQAKLGVGWATIQAALPGSAARRADVTLTEVDETLAASVQASGPGPSAERQRLLRELLLRLTEPEQRFLGGLLVGELRQGPWKDWCSRPSPRRPGCRRGRFGARR
jgi:DNA ligase-1